MRGGVQLERDSELSAIIAERDVYKQLYESVLERLIGGKLDGKQYSLHSEFDIEQHKKCFPHYLEVIIGPDGEVMYAVPSHQYKLIQIACEKYGIDRDELDEMCPPEDMFDYTHWLCKMTDCIALWEFQIEYHAVNHKQMAMLRRLKPAGLYLGLLPEIP